MADVIGRAPTVYEQLLMDDAKQFAPSVSMERLDTHAKFLFGTVATVGILIAGVGLLKPDHPTLWIALPVAIMAASLACAIWAITPQHYQVDGSNLNNLRAHYDHLLRHRGRLIRAAGSLFALALLSTPFVFWAGRERDAAGCRWRDGESDPLRDGRYGKRTTRAFERPGGK